MINTKFLKNLIEAFPNGSISDPFANASYLFDKDKTMIGHFDYTGECFYLNKEYEYLKEAKHVLREHGVNYKLKQYKEHELIYN